MHDLTFAWSTECWSKGPWSQCRWIVLSQWLIVTRVSSLSWFHRFPQPPKNHLSWVYQICLPLSLQILWPCFFSIEFEGYSQLRCTAHIHIHAITQNAHTFPHAWNVTHMHTYACIIICSSMHTHTFTYIPIYVHIQIGTYSHAHIHKRRRIDWDWAQPNLNSHNGFPT